MKAAVIDRLGAAPKPAELPDPVAATEGQVVIKVEAAALNPVDLIIAGGLHPAGQPKLPYVPGIEAVGTIVAGPERGLRVRATVPAGLVAGLDGGAAELLLTDRAGCLPVPDGLDSVGAAAVGVVGASADLALREAQLTPERTSWCSARRVPSAWRSFCSPGWRGQAG